MNWGTVCAQMVLGTPRTPPPAFLLFLLWATRSAKEPSHSYSASGLGHWAPYPNMPQSLFRGFPRHSEDTRKHKLQACCRVDCIMYNKPLVTL